MDEDCYPPENSKLLLEEEAPVELAQLCFRISPALVNECIYDGQTSLEKAPTRNCSVDVGRCILEVFPATVSMPNDEGNDLRLQTAIQHGCLAEIIACIFKVMPKAAVRHCRSSPLHLLLSEQIMRYSSEDSLNLLLSKRSNKASSFKLVRFLRERGFDMDFPMRQSRSFSRQTDKAICPCT
jgi:hypothetical protein